MEVTDKRHYVVTRLVENLAEVVVLVLCVDNKPEAKSVEELFEEVMSTSFPYIHTGRGELTNVSSEVRYREVRKITYLEKQRNHILASVYVQDEPEVYKFAITWYKSYQ